MERAIDCQTEAIDVSEEIKISDKLNQILISYAKSVILHNPLKNNENESEDESESIIKKKIYSYSKEYFRKLLAGIEVNNNIDNISVNCNLISDFSNSNVIKDQIKKEMERVNFNIKNS